MAVQVNVYNLEGKPSGKVSLSEEIFAAHVDEKLIAQAVRVYLANQRQGTAATKTRGEVRGSGRKIWRQKGTGRARHGDRYAPIFVGGGLAHGPKIRDFSLKLPKKMKRKALFGTLTLKLKEKAILVVKDLTKIKPKTKELWPVLTNLKLKTKKGKLLTKTLLITRPKEKNLVLAGRNLENLSLKEVNLLNPYIILAHQQLVLMKEAIPVLKKTFLKKT